MSASTLYQQVVLDHYRHPRHRGAVDGFTHCAEGANPLCGDRLRVEATCDGHRIVKVGFAGEACAIATASGSMLGDLVANRSSSEVGAWADRFSRMIESGVADDELGELNAMRELQRYPGRRKCALLPWATLRAALAGVDRTTTESESR
ncbi:MAG: Fe-S cluster assembly sulfur transfer protein SufU [Dokdonella sp.]|uniref:Fe-S cluster assembly sulfur transfer protein SufU n=1 Tax=Dokdonella sp. TaxID=2291710 RepID=UPI0032636C1F